MSSEVHKVRTSFAPDLVNFICAYALTDSMLWHITLEKKNLWHIGLFLMVLVRMGIFDSNTRCGQTGKIPLGFLDFAIHMIFEYCMKKNNGLLPRS